jgi:DNA-directed RNA polymerase specialized sigma subunit
MAFLEPMDANRLEPRYQGFYSNWKSNPSTANAGALLKAVQPDIDRGIFAHVGKSDPLLASKARRMALQAVRTYDPSKARLGTHIVNQLQGLKRVSRQQSQILPIPERVTMDQGYIQRAKAELEDEYGREPTAQELADRTGISVKRINYVNKFRYPMAVGSMTNMSEEDDDLYAPEVDQMQSNSWLEFVYSDLDPTNQKIMEWTLGLHGNKPLSNQEIARKLRMTPGAVSQRKAKIQNILNQEELNPFAS